MVRRDYTKATDTMPTKTTTTAAEVIASINTNEAFGIAWGADGEVLTYDETTAAIDAGRGWFDTQGRWINKAGFEKRVAAELEAYRVARLTAN